MDDDISLFELKNHINLHINNSTISNYLINEFKIKYFKNKNMLLKKKLKDINNNELKLTIKKIYNNYIQELHYKKYQQLLSTFDSNTKEILDKMTNLLEKL
jgi:hypothetical protein